MPRDTARPFTTRDFVRMNRIAWLFVCAVAFATQVEGANRTVCRSGCQYTNLQTAINEATPGDVILLRAGETFTGNFVLKAKDAAATQYITIRSDAPDSSFPAAGTRLIPEGEFAANVARATLPKLLGQGGGYKSTPVIRTAPGAHHYRLMFLEIDGTANLGYETLVQLGENTSNQTTITSAPHHFVLDRVYLHGHATKGMKRGVTLDCRDAEVVNSFISDIKSLADAQAIAVFNGAGPFRIENNYLEASGENVLFGGADPRTANLVPSDITIRHNYFVKPLSWRNALLAAPSRVTTSAGLSGSLASGTHYFKVVAMMGTGGASANSAPSTEVAVVTGAGGSVTISWSAVSGADSYRVYRGRSAGGQSVYTSLIGTAMNYTGAGESSGAPKSSASRWVAKNLIEFKNGQRALIDGNRFENNWAGFQQGYAIVLTPRNQENSAPWSVVRDITFTNNRVINVASALNILGTDDINPSQRFRNLIVRNNIFEIDTAMGGTGIFMTMTSGPANIRIDHNTIIHTGKVVNVSGPAVSGFSYTYNMSRHNTYGVQGQNYGIGLSTLNQYFPGHVFTGNVLAGGNASLYPAGNYFPSVAQFNAAFVDAASGNYAIAAGALLAGAPITVGVAMPTLEAAEDGAPTGSSAPSVTSPPPTGTPGPLPSGWQSADIGNPGVTGAAGYEGATYSLSGGGADVWGTFDEFRYAFRVMSGDGTIVARVASVQGAEAWTKAGVMIRASDDPRSAHASMFVSVAKGLAFQRRATTGATSRNTAGAAAAAPEWVRLERVGNALTASTSADGRSWTEVGRDTITLPSDVLVGLAITSHDETTLATATFDNVSVGPRSLPAGWSTSDIGSVGVAGSASASAGTFTVEGAGADVWGMADALHFTSTTLSGDGDVVARVASVSGAEAWTKVGVMMRTTADPGAPQAFMLISVGKGAAFQRRTVAGGTSASTSGGAATAPRWVKLSRRGTTITGSVSFDGQTWTLVGTDTFSIGDSLLVGLAVSSHDPGTLATGTFDNVAIASAP
jgi:regulation of enolase protein 1 (concanavalin A-like superfamily)/pectate lyase